MELEMANGYTIVAREFDRNGQSLILAVEAGERVIVGRYFS